MAEEIFIGEPGKGAVSALFSMPDECLLEKFEETLIIMAHGFPGRRNGHNDLFGDLEGLMVESGFRTLRFNFRGCGEKDPPDSLFSFETARKDFQNIHHWARENGYKRLGYIAEGLGASFCLMNMTDSVKFLIFAWPALNLKLHAREYFQSDTIKDALVTRDFSDYRGVKISRHFLDYMENCDITSILEASRVPALIMHGEQDQTIPISHLELVRQHMNGPRIEITTFEDGNHGLTKLSHRKMMFYHISQFVEKYAWL